MIDFTRNPPPRGNDWDAFAQWANTLPDAHISRDADGNVTLDASRYSIAQDSTQND